MGVAQIINLCFGLSTINPRFWGVPHDLGNFKMFPTRSARRSPCNIGDMRSMMLRCSVRRVRLLCAQDFVNEWIGLREHLQENSHIKWK